MALSYSNTINYGVRSDRLQKGTKVLQVDVTVGATSDYSSGLSLTASKMGFGQIHAVLGASFRQSGGTLRAYAGLYDYNTSKLRFYNGTTEWAASDGATNDVVRCVVMGA